MRAALTLIEVGYARLPHGITLDQAIAEGAPLEQAAMITRNVMPVPTRRSNITRR